MPVSTRTALPLILGSASAGRREVLAQAGYVFDVMSADIDEKAIRHPDPSELTVRIATAKADALLPHIAKPSLLITADQVVMWGDEIREKPVDETQARYFLETVSECPLTMFSAVVVTDTASGRRASGVDRASVRMEPLPAKLIDEIITDKSAFRHAAGFPIQDERLQPFVDRVEGTLDSVIGLPLHLLRKLLNDVQSHAATERP